MDGLLLLREIKARHPAVTVIMMTAYATIEKAVEAIKLGAYDFIKKPLNQERLMHLIRKGLELNRLVRQNSRLIEEMCLKDELTRLVGQSKPIQAVREKIAMLAQSEATVLIQGETGTGKELAARAIHNLSDRRRHALVTVNCPALPETLLESELFGYAKGAFTDAVDQRLGMFDQAHGSTIFLDEIGDISPSVQSKLLRVLQAKEVKPLGSQKSHTVDVRIIAATNQDLERKMKRNTFREDLFYRLNVARVTMPALDKIREDIPLLVDHFLEQVSCEQKKPCKAVRPEVINALLGRPWPGNTRQLENLVRSWYAMTSDREIRSHHLAAETGASQNDSAGLDLEKPYQDLKERAVEAFTLDYLNRLLQQTRGNVSLAAKISGLRRQSLQKIIKRYNIDVSHFRP
jgi:DNA-binding NtrC family response regulator